MRPVRPADRKRLLEISAGVWGGNDYLPGVLDEWIQDPGGQFEAAEVDGVVVGVHRLRPIGRRVMFYEGVRVAAEQRRRGHARRMLGLARAQAQEQGFRQLRLVTGNPEAAALYESEGFRLLVACRPWVASRVEGGDPPPMAAPGDAGALFSRLQADPSLAAYGGVNPHWKAVLDIDPELLAELAGAGLVRTRPGGRALAIVQPDPQVRLGVTFIAGSGGVLRDLLTQLRYEADSLGLEGVWALVPEGHPAEGDLTEVGYDLGEMTFRHLSYGLELTS